MTLAEMRLMLRRRIDDTRSRRWSDADIDNELTFAARFVVKELAIYQLDNTLWQNAAANTPVLGAFASNGTTVITNVNGISSRAATSIPMTDLIRPIAFKQTNGTGALGRFVDVSMLHRYSGSMDDSGMWVASLVFGFDDVISDPLTTVDLLFNKSFTPSSDAGVFSMDYVSFVGLAQTGDAYQTMDESYQELIVIRAALMLIGSDNANFDFLRQVWNDGYSKLKSGGSYRIPQNKAMPQQPPQAVPFGDGV